VDVFFTHEQLTRGAIVEEVVRGLDADARAWRKAKCVIDVPKFLAEHEQRRAEKAQTSEQRLERSTGEKRPREEGTRECQTTEVPT
jgi:hypothetical protein